MSECNLSMLEFLWWLGKDYPEEKIIAPLAELSGAEAKIILALVTSADGGTREAYPSVETLGNRIGKDKRGARRAIKALQEKGLLVKTFESDGRNTNTYRFEIPTGVKSTPVKNGRLTGAKDARQPGQKIAANRGKKCPPNISIEHSQELIHPTSPAGGGVAGGSNAKEEKRIADLKSALIAFGLREPTLRTVLAIPGIFALHARLLWIEATKSGTAIKNPAGFIATMLARGAGSLPGTLEPKQAAELINSLQICRIAGRQVYPRAKWGRAGIMLDGDTSPSIAAGDLLIASIELAAAPSRPSELVDLDAYKMPDLNKPGGGCDLPTEMPHRRSPILGKRSSETV